MYFIWSLLLFVQVSSNDAIHNSYRGSLLSRFLWRFCLCCWFPHWFPTICSINMCVTQSAPIRIEVSEWRRLVAVGEKKIEYITKISGLFTSIEPLAFVLMIWFFLEGISMPLVAKYYHQLKLTKKHTADSAAQSRIVSKTIHLVTN